MSPVNQNTAATDGKLFPKTGKKLPDAPNGGGTAFFHVPTLRERIWRRLGFRYHLGEEPKGCEVLQGWMRTEIRLRFGWMDRLRLLITGRLLIVSTVHTDTPSPAVCKSRVDWMIETGEARR